MSKPSVPPLVHRQIRLRLLEEADLPMTRAWRNQDEIRKWFLHSDVISVAQHQGWYDHYRDRDDDFVFVIEETDLLKRPVGQVAIYHVDRDRRRAEFGRLLIGDQEARGRGLATMATRALIDRARVLFAVREIYLSVLASNTVARAIYASCGFTETGRDQATVQMRLDLGATGC